VVTAADALDALPALVAFYGEPFGNNSVLGTYFCARLARECGVRRLLAGDGGDEIFGGNERYRTDRIFARYGEIPAIVRRGVLEPVLLSLPSGGDTVLGKAQRYVRRANIPNPARFYSYEFFFARDGRTLLDPSFLAGVAANAPHDVIERHYRAASAGSELNRLLYLDLKLTIADNDLYKVVRSAELAEIGVRFPFLDPGLVQFTGELPASYKVRDLELRYLFKRAFGSLLAPETLRKTKHGFGVPTSEWMRTPGPFRDFANDVLRSRSARERGYFRPRAIEELSKRHQGDVTPYYGDLLWSVLMLELWHRQHADVAGAK
jgi:asparagine synthase (glutamine-hydrolysing)